MPTKTSTKPETPRATTKKEAPAPLTPAVEAKPEKFSGFVQKWRENVDHRLTRYLKDFVDDAMPEEKAFMLEVLCRWESNTCGGRLRGFNEHEIPLLSAILTGNIWSRLKVNTWSVKSKSSSRRN